MRTQARGFGVRSLGFTVYGHKDCLTSVADFALVAGLFLGKSVSPKSSVCMRFQIFWQVLHSNRRAVGRFLPVPTYSSLVSASTSAG